ncbi:MAG: DoxX family protein [Chitinophagaceae bacterium]|nr:DoxX family protein [Chitinophagaceae bacterium]
MNIKLIAVWILRLAAAYFMLQTLYFKFAGAEESIYIFTQVGMEPWGRYGTGALELIASILILWPRTTGFGALMGVGLMSGALFFHITKLGIEIKGDGGLLFAYALIVFISSAILLLIYKSQVLAIIKKKQI